MYYTVSLPIIVFSITFILKNHSNLIMCWKRQLHIVLTEDLVSIFSGTWPRIHATAVSLTLSCLTFAF